jgi:hypothetical protein
MTSEAIARRLSHPGEGITSRVDSRQMLGRLASNRSQLSRQPELRRTGSQRYLESQSIDHLAADRRPVKLEQLRYIVRFV